ncbi:3-oxoacyl-[acyl-carrier-protein] reductase FabG-like isoform X1 [Haliotis rubra]|uniref:3-oxoacyl-[acyl-carrier-protein] reductase FabG-like isoform X1 n=1 Tax=Haliotis rubra TaxID=36100 RepID=UPI001EE6268A|nr:3-oxoacyl-[acyl-carrier-protein] reductase FabG-like isoform X1 [Haliotis rubra]
MANFAGRVVLITGASAGLGEGTALHFAKQGAKLALTGREKTRLDDVAKRCSECGIPADNIRTHCGDLTDAAFRKATIEKTVAKFARLDVLVNNAGLVFPGESMGMSEPQYDQTMDLNMKVPFLMSQLAVPHLEKTQGNIVNISSLFGARAMAMTGIYCVSKAALDMFTQCLALELAPKKVRVNSVNPGTVATPIFGREGSVLHGKDDEIKKFLEEQANATPLGRLGTPQDVAGAIGYLASDAASYVTGQILLVDGGRSCTFK